MYDGGDPLKSNQFRKNKQEILEVASLLFDQKGYTKTTMRDIATQCESSLGGITYYFPKKFDIAKSLQQKYQKNFYTQIRKIYSKLDLSMIEADTVYLYTVTETSIKDQKRCAFLYDLYREGKLTDLVSQSIFMQFTRKVHYLNLGWSNQEISIYNFFYIGMYQQLIEAVNRGWIEDVDKAIKLFNIHHLHQLEFSPEETKAILNVALPICKDIQIHSNHLFDLQLHYPKQTTKDF